MLAIRTGVKLSVGKDGKCVIPAGKITDDTYINVSSKPIITDLSKLTVIAQFNNDGKWINNSTVYDKDKASLAQGIVPDKLVIKQGSKEIELDPDDCAVSYINNKTAGTAYVVLSSTSAFTKGTKEQSFKIKGVAINDSKLVSITYSQSLDWNGMETVPNDLTITDIKTNTVLKDYDKVDDESQADYRLIYSNSDKPGKATITIIGLNGYDGSVDKKYTIKPADFAKAVSDKSQINAGDCGIVVPNVGDMNFTSKQIKPMLNNVVFVYKTGSEKGLSEGKDYTVSFGKNTDAGTGTIKVTGKGNYAGSITREFNIKKQSFSTQPLYGISVPSIPNTPYKGKPVTVSVNPVLTVPYVAQYKLKAGKDYTVTYANNDEPGEATLTFTGCGKNFEGSKTVTFNITDKNNDISKAFIFDTKSAEAKEILNNSKIYNTNSQTLSDEELAVIIKAKTTENAPDPQKNVNYSVSYSDNKNAGKVKVTFTGIGLFYGSKTIDMKINQKGIASPDELEIATEYNEYIYTGDKIQPVVNVKDKATGKSVNYDKSSYTVKYKNNINAGTGTAIITLNGNYTGLNKNTKSIEIPFTINKLNLNDYSVKYEYEAENKFLGGKKEVKPAVSVYSDTNGVRYKINPKVYKIVYNSQTDKNVGVTSFTVEPAKGNINVTCDQPIVKGYSITPVDLEDTVISVIKPITFLGKPVTPKFKVTYNGVTLVEGRDYKVEFDGNDVKGIASAWISGLGENYNGAKSVFFVLK